MLGEVDSCETPLAQHIQFLVLVDFGRFARMHEAFDADWRLSPLRLS